MGEAEEAGEAERDGGGGGAGERGSGGAGERRSGGAEERGSGGAGGAGERGEREERGGEGREPPAGPSMWISFWRAVRDTVETHCLAADKRICLAALSWRGLQFVTDAGLVVRRLRAAEEHLAGEQRWRLIPLIRARYRRG